MCMIVAFSRGYQCYTYQVGIHGKKTVISIRGLSSKNSTAEAIKRRLRICTQEWQQQEVVVAYLQTIQRFLHC